MYKKTFSSLLVSILLFFGLTFIPSNISAQGTCTCQTNFGVCILQDNDCDTGYTAECTGITAQCQVSNAASCTCEPDSPPTSTPPPEATPTNEPIPTLVPSCSSYGGSCRLGCESDEVSVGSEPCGANLSVCCVPEDEAPGPPECNPGEDCCTCARGSSTGGYSCSVDLLTDNCNDDKLAICEESTILCSLGEYRPCSCQTEENAGCGTLGQACCTGDVCFEGECLGLGFGYSRCLEPCDTNDDCENGQYCNASGGCTNSPFTRQPKIDQDFFCGSDEGGTNDPESGELYTAVGCIPVSRVSETITFIFQLGISLGGGIALLLIAYAGIMIKTSAGDPQRAETGRELLIAAIVGLLLMIFAVFILRVAGVSLFGIPGLGG